MHYRSDSGTGPLYHLSSVSSLCFDLIQHSQDTSFNQIEAGQVISLLISEAIDIRELSISLLATVQCSDQ